MVLNTELDGLVGIKSYSSYYLCKCLQDANDIYYVNVKRRRHLCTPCIAFCIYVDYACFLQNLIFSQLRNLNIHRD